MKYQFNLKSVLNLTNFQEAKNTVGQDRHFLAMVMLKQAWHCSFGLPKMFKIMRIGKVVLKGGSKGAFLASKKGGVVQMLCKFVLRKSQVPDYQALDYPKKSGRQDSNLRPPGPKPGALPGCATPREEYAVATSLF